MLVVQKKRNIGLDIVRCVAILLVLVHHWKHHLDMIIPKSIHYLQIFGYYGVEMFFVLSGFLIGNILIKSFLESENYDFNSIKIFWMRRWLRTLPLYYSVLIVYIGIYYLNHHSFILPDGKSFLRYFFFLQNLTNNTFIFFAESWSLCIEEWFYLTFPLTLFLVNVICRKFLSKGQIILIVILLYLILVPLLRIYIVQAINPQWNLGIRPVVLYRLDSIAFGVVLSFIYKYFPLFWSESKNWLAVAGMILIVASSFIFMNDIAYNYHFKTGDVSWFSKTILFSFVNIGFACLMPFFFHVDLSNRILKHFVTYISKISYSLYLINLFVTEYLNKTVPSSGRVSALIILILFLVICIVVATGTFQLIEESFLRIRDKYWRDSHKAL